MEEEYYECEKEPGEKHPRNTPKKNIFTGGHVAQAKKEQGLDIYSLKAYYLEMNDRKKWMAFFFFTTRSIRTVSNIKKGGL